MNKSNELIEKLNKLDDNVDEAASRSLSRIHSHMNSDREIGVISSERTHDDEDSGGDGHKFTPKERNDRHKALKNDIEAAGYGYTSMHGEYHGNRERSLMVFSKEKGKDSGLLPTLMHFGKKYGQDSILHKPHDATEPNLHFTMNRNGSSIGDSFKLGRIRPQKTGKFGSTEISKGDKQYSGNRTNASKKGFAFSNGKEIKPPSVSRLKKSMNSAGLVRDDSVWKNQT